MTEISASPERRNRGRFQKGQSGNPAGRPKKLTHSSPHAFDIVIDRTLPVTSNGVERQVSMEEALQLKTYQEAISGKRSAQKQVKKWIEKREAHLAKNQQTSAPKCIFRGFREDPVNANEAMVLLEIVNHNPDGAGVNNNRTRLLLEPWAIEAALRRRRNAKPIKDEDLDAIRSCTRNASMIPALAKLRKQNDGYG